MDTEGTADRRAHPSFSVFDCDPLVLGRLRRVNSYVVAVGAVAGGLFMMVVATWAQGTLAHPGSDVFAGDIRAYFRLGDAAADPDFTLLRDHASVIQAVLWAASLGVVHRQWQLFEALMPGLDRTGIFHIPNRRKFDAAVRVANRRIARSRRVRPTLVRLGIGAVLAALYVIVELWSGVFAVLAPPGVSRTDWADVAYDNWWAGISVPGLGFAVYLGLLVVGLYYLVTLNLVGWRLLWVFLRRAERIEWRLNRLNPGGYYGWDVPRRILWTVYVMVLLHVAIVSLAFVVIPLGSFAAWVLFVILGGVLIFYPFYLAVPLVWLHRSLRRHKERVVAGLLADADVATAADTAVSVADAAAQRRIREEVEAIRALPTLPFRRIQIASGLGLLLSVVALVQFVAETF